MKLINTKVEKILVTDLDNLDAVSIYLEEWKKKVTPEKEVNQGKIIVTCYDKCYSAFFGSMTKDLKRFIIGTDNDYLAGKLAAIDHHIIDYDQVSKDIGEEVNEDSIHYQHTQLNKKYGGDWHYEGLPTKENPNYIYLCTILDSVRSALSEWVLNNE